MAQTVEINGQKYRVWYKHRHSGMTDLYLCKVIEAFEDAVGLGQVSEAEQSYSDIIGVTLCQLEDQDRNVVAKGYSFCSEKDNFNKKIGRAISLGRAKKALGECAPVVDGGLSKTSDTSSE